MWHICSQQDVLMLIFTLRITSNLYDGSFFRFTTQPRLCVFSPGWCIWSLACTLFMCSLQDATHSLSPLPLKPSKAGQWEWWSLWSRWNEAELVSNDWVEQAPPPIKQYLAIFKRTQLNWRTFQDAATLFQAGLLLDPKQRSQQATADSIRLFHRLQRRADSEDG